MDITKNIKAIRERKKIKQIDIAARMNLERSNYSRIENKGNEISIRQLLEIAAALEVALFELIFPQEAKSLSKANSTIPKLVQSNEDLLDYKNKADTFFKFLTTFAPGLEQMGLTEEKVRTQLDPDGKLEAYTKEKLKELTDSLNEP